MSLSTSKWPTEAAKGVRIVLDADGTSNNNGNNNLARIEYNATDRYICLVRDNDDDDDDEESARTILDTIDVEDMVGASIEISVLNDDTTEHIRADGDAARYQSNEPSSINAVDTQARAVLNLYVYPRQDPSSVWKRCVGRLFSPRSGSSTATPHYQRPADASQHGPRVARHRQWTLAAAEDLRAAQTLVQALRELATPHAFNNNNNNGGSRRRCLLLVNPRSGPHRDAAVRAETVVVPLLEQAGLDVTVCVTTHPQHATERCRQDDVVVNNAFDAVVTMGGDGIVHEALNGLMLRNSHTGIKSNHKTQLPAIGVIGCGTANGLASSLVAAAGESVPSSDILTHAFLIAKGETVPADLAEYTVVTTPTAAASTADDNSSNNGNNGNNSNTTSKKKYISFLTFTYGLLADIDIESERMHWLGSTRFDVWGAFSVLRRRYYRATFRYTTSTTTSDNNADDGNVSTWTTIEDDFVGLVASQVTHVSGFAMEICLLETRTLEFERFLYTSGGLMTNYLTLPFLLLFFILIFLFEYSQCNSSSIFKSAAKLSTRHRRSALATASFTSC